MSDTLKRLREVLDSNARASCEADREVLALVDGIIGDRDNAIKECDKMRVEINILEDRGLYRENDLRSIIGLLGLTKDEAVVVGWPGIRARIENLVNASGETPALEAFAALTAERDEAIEERDSMRAERDVARADADALHKHDRVDGFVAQAADALVTERDELKAELYAWKVAEERLCAQFNEVCRSRDVYGEEDARIREALVGVRQPGESALETVERLVAAHLSHAPAGVAP